MADFDKLVLRIIEASRKAERSNTVTECEIGKATHRAILARIGRTDERKKRRNLRAEALILISERLKAEGCPRCNLNRAVQVYAVGQCFGESDAKSLPVSSVREFSRLIRRDTLTEKWSTKAKTEESAKALFVQVVAGDVQPSAVRAAVDSILGTKPKAPRAPKPKPNPAVEWARFAIGAEADVLGAALAAMANTDRPAFDRIARIIQTVAEKAEAPTIPTDKPTEKSAKGFISRRGRRAA